MTASLVELANHSSYQVRQQAISAFAALSAEEQQKIFAELLQSSYKDVREGIFDFLSSERLQADHAWLDAIRRQCPESPSQASLLSIGLLVLLARFEHPSEPSLLAFGEKCLASEDPDLQYQALFFLELHNDDSPAYLEALPNLLGASDEDVRIIAIQAITRLSPAWGAEKLAEHAKHARGQEGFHTLLGRLSLGDDATRKSLEEALIRDLYDDRFCYPAILALKQYGSETSVPHLLRLAGSFLGEPTMRITAADAAAKLGSSEGLVWLQKFAEKSGNTEYARQLLANYPPQKK